MLPNHPEIISTHIFPLTIYLGFQVLLLEMWRAALKAGTAVYLAVGQIFAHLE